MADTPPSKRSDEASGANMGWAAVGYLMAGIGVWGFLGWLVDHWLGVKGIFLSIGMVLGAAGGIYLIVKRLGS